MVCVATAKMIKLKVTKMLGESEVTSVPDDTNMVRMIKKHSKPTITKQ